MPIRGFDTPPGETEMTHRIFAIVLAAAIAAAAPALAGEVSCSGFALGYDGPAKKTTCRSEDDSTGSMESRTDEIEVIDQAFNLWVSYHHTGLRTYIPSHTVMELLRGSSFAQVEVLGISRSVRGFDTVAFTTVPSGKNYKLLCALFARYSGNPGNYEFDGGPGTRNAVIGTYCADPGFLTPAQQGDGFYGVVEQTISKLRLPSD
jgi:hypothetical protein